jgi:hypothetical protein
MVEIPCVSLIPGLELLPNRNLPSFCRVAATDTFDFRAFEPSEQMPDHVQTDFGTGLLNCSDGEKSRLGFNGGLDEGGLRATRRSDLSGALFKFRVTPADDG